MSEARDAKEGEMSGERHLDTWERRDEAEQKVEELERENAGLLERVGELKEIIQEYGRHTNKCRIYAIVLREPTAKDCTCGFVTALSQAKLENQEDRDNV